MHNNIMAAGSKDRPPMLGPGRYSQWRSRFLRYLDTKSNGEYLRKCIFEGKAEAKAEQADWLEDTDSEIDEQEMEAHRQLHGKNHEGSHLKKSVDQNVAECVDERVALANLIANLTLDTEENKTILKQLKKANASLTQELEECKTNLDETSRALGEATSSRDSCTDKSEIIRKQSKASKHGHENQKSSKRSQRFKAEARKVKPQSNPVKEKPIIGQQNLEEIEVSGWAEDMVVDSSGLRVAVGYSSLLTVHGPTAIGLCVMVCSQTERSVRVNSITSVCEDKLRILSQEIHTSNDISHYLHIVLEPAVQRATNGEARDWLDKEPPRSILTWDDLVSKFINQYFPPSKTTYYRNEIITFYQKPNEAFNEAWERFKGLLRQCPHHGFSELHQLDTFYNSLNSNDQDALDSAAGGNFLDKMPQEGLAIIESKSKVRYSRSRANDSRVSTDAPLSNSSPSNNSFDMQQIAASLEDKMTIKMNQMMNQMKALVVTTPAPVKAVEEVCVTCGSNHHFNLCPLTRGGNDFPVFHDNIQQFQQTAAVDVASSRFPSTNNQLRTSSNPRNQASIQEGRVTVQQVQGRRRKLDKFWMKSNSHFLQIQGVPNGQDVPTIIPNNAAFQTEDLDTYDSDCDDISNAQAVLMANIYNYGSDVILEVSHSETYLNDMENQGVQAMQDFEQPPTVDFTENEIHSDSNIILTNVRTNDNHVNNWEKANEEQNNESVIAELERYKERVKTFEQRFNIDLSSREKMIDSQMDDMIKEKLALKEQVDSLEQNLSKQIKEKECLLQTFTIFKSESKEKKDKYMENEIDLEKKIKELDNFLFKLGQSAQTMHMLTKPQAFYDNIHKQALGYQNPFQLRKAQRIKPTLYDGIVISDKHVAMHVIDDEETLILKEKSRSKIKPSDASPVKIEAPKELPKVSLVNERLKKLKFHLVKFDKVVKIRTTPDAPTEGKEVVENVCHIKPSATTIAPGMFKLDLVLLPPRSEVVQIVLWYLDSGCSKHMTGNRSQLMNFVSKFLGTVRFGNNQIARIMGYGDYQLGNVIISRVYYVEGLGHNLFSVGQFCDADLEVAFQKNTCFIRNLEGVDLLLRVQ
ncbi:reverse transcriptase domain-containing protein [Tanacetum coccineum]